MKPSLKIICIACAIFLIACAQKEKLEEVNYRLKWLYNVSAVGDLYAATRGYFHNAEASQRLLDGSWLNTGDLAPAPISIDDNEPFLSGSTSVV